MPWLLGLLDISWSDLRSIEQWMIPFLVVGIYVLGMVMDLVAFRLVHPLKWRLRKHAATSAGFVHDAKGGAAADRQLRILRAAPALAAEIEARSSRDRIARGAALNGWLCLVVWWSHLTSCQILLGAGVCIVLSGMWLFHEKRSHLFELNAIRVFEKDPPTGERP